MPARSTGSGTISFGLVSIPIRLYVATHSEQLSFNQLHTPCGTRIRQQLFCPHCDRVVERSELDEIGACSCYEHQIDLVCTNRLRSRLLGHALRLSETCSDT